MTYIIWCLIKHPDVDRRLRTEISSLPQDWTGTDLANLPYLDGVVRETLRLYPPAPSPMPRVVPENGFQMDGSSLPPGVSSSVFTRGN